MIFICKVKNGNEEENVKEMFYFFVLGIVFFFYLCVGFFFLGIWEGYYKRLFFKEYRGRIKIYGYFFIFKEKKKKREGNSVV